MMPSVPLITGQRVMDFLFPDREGWNRGDPGRLRNGKNGF